MQNIIIDLPELNERVNLPSDQWKSLRQWLEERDIAYEEQAPTEADVETNSQTVMVFQIADHNESVSNYLESRP